jgi:uncharacterized membrane protein YesL
MNILDSKFHRWLEVFANFLLLNLLWLLACIPVLTIYPATAAMFAVVRDWVRKNDVGVIQPFILRFRENFRQSFVIGIVWTVSGTALVLDFYLVNQLPSGLRTILYLVLSLMLLLYTFTSVYLFPVMVHFDTTWPVVLKNSLLLGIGRLLTTVQCLLVIVTMISVSVFAPFTLLITGSTTAYIVYRLCDREFRRVEAITRDRGA